MMESTAEDRIDRGPRWRKQRRLKNLLMVVALATIGLGVFLDPIAGGLLTSLLGGLGIALAVLAGAMALGFLGFGLFAAFGRVVDWLRSAATWPEPADDPWK